MVKALCPELKFARIKNGLFQKDVAENVGITVNAYALIEGGKKTTTGKTAKSICDCLNVKFDDVFEIK